MSKLMIIICFCALYFVCISGCKEEQRYVTLNKESIMELDVSKIKEISMLSPPPGKKDFKHAVINWKDLRKDVFPISDPNKINAIVNCIKDANFVGESIILSAEIHLLVLGGIDPNYSVEQRSTVKNIFTIEPNQLSSLRAYIDDKSPMIMPEDIAQHWICFKTQEIIYVTPVLWDNNKIYGGWWESSELRNYFKEWRVIPK